MFYYEVATSGKVRGTTAIFTYEHHEKLNIGSIVSIVVRGKRSLGFIVKKVTKPEFKTNTLDTINDPLSLPEQTVRTYTELTSLYPFSESSLANLFIPPPAPKKTVETKHKTFPKATTLPSLNNEQKRVVQELSDTTKNSILLGDTGTGKTRIYMHLIKAQLDLGKNVILLAPEIGLSTFLYRDILPYFPSAILYHSTLTPKQRYLNWKQAHDALGGQLIVGPRSALTLPVQNIGLIILDEAHDSSYRQDGSPYLHAKVVAALLAKNYQAKCVYGTATPSIIDLYNAKKLGNPVVIINKMAVESSKESTVQVVDYANDAERNGGSILKSALLAVSDAVSKNGQALVLVNRRGTARYVSCQSCGHEERCSVCDHLVVYHHDTYELRCHFCDKRTSVPNNCSECGSTEIRMSSFGTKAIVSELSQAFTDTIIRRFDTDLSKKDQLLEHVESLMSGEVQIIVGTQMIAKGLDLPKLRTLVVLASSTGSSYTSDEKDFQLLYQVLGRAMRGHQNTNIVIQTSNPDSKVIELAVNRDFQSYYAKELEERKKFYYPPFCHMMVIHCRRKTSKGAHSSVSKLKHTIEADYTGVMVSEPMPNLTERTGDNFNWHLLLKAPKRSTLTTIARDIGSGWVCELDPGDTP